MAEIEGKALPDPNIYIPPPSIGGAQRGGLEWLAAGVVAGATGHAASGPGFKYSREQLETIAQKWEDLADRYQEDKIDARIMTQAQGPGVEYASQDNAALLRTSGETLLTTLDERVQYCRAQVKKCRAALGQYEAAEDEHEAEINKQGEY
ncbi:hypothetical protein [Amycolatopsis cihanbeyliensis]|uniref:PE family protein n=1 Tax=Amycolatopsis cihanbeyliensis TaxID=1128664 RepID=A0A542DIE0_AMYCI|nr:hypothetical protein [Amycolatopsis cihanbeyliensis]TQJ02867.1 hypothetical protein FB471_2615 [Amycolatopsis cihanbeyliensis]